MTVGLGLVTCDRDDYFRQVLTSWDKADLRSVSHHAEVWNDQTHQGVGRCKNALMRRLLDKGCDWIIISEDDILVDSPLAVTGYIEAAESAGLHHLSFAHHGPRNGPFSSLSPIRFSPQVEFYPNAVGAWSLYSREILTKVGLLDEGFPKNVLEHVEHSARINAATFPVKPSGFPDAVGSDRWLHEIPGSALPENRVIHEGPTDFDDGKAYWKEHHPDTYLWGD